MRAFPPVMCHNYCGINDVIRGGEMMSVMSAQMPLDVVPEAGPVMIGQAAALVEDDRGGRVFVHGELTHMWGSGDQTSRRLAAVQLVRIRAARAGEVAAAFGVDPETLRRWSRAADGRGAAALVPVKRGPQGPSKMTAQVVADIQGRREGGASLRAIAAEVGVSTASVRRALATEPEADESARWAHGDASGVKPEVLAQPAPRGTERALARGGMLGEVAPVFTPAARIPLAGMLAAVPGLEATGLLSCARGVYGELPAGFYGLATMLAEGVFRALAGAPRAEGAARFDPAALGRVLGIDRAPEVKTIRRKIGQLASVGRASDLLAGMAAHHLARSEDPDLVLYVDGHVRAYQGTKRVPKTHLSRLRFPAPATVETWISDAAGDPVLVVMSEPGASLAMELRRLLPDLRKAVGDQRRVLVGFDRGGWSPTLFQQMNEAGFDLLTWRKGRIDDLDPSAFSDTSFVDETGRTHAWTLADTLVELPLKDGTTVAMRQVTRLDASKAVTKQVHILTTRTDLTAAEIVYRMGSRWRQENYFHYARMHLGLDSHDSYAATDDDPERSVPNPAKRHAHLVVQNASARRDREKARAEAALLTAQTPGNGSRDVTVTNPAYNALTGPWYSAEDELAAARAQHREIPARIRLGDLAPDQQVLDTETKLIHHAIKIAAFNTSTAIARDIRLHTTYARAEQEAYTLARQVLTQPGDILPDHDTGTLTVRLDPLPTGRETAAVAELCEHLTATATTYPGTDLTLRYEIKTRT